MFLFSLLMTATYELLIPGLRIWTVANKRSHVHQTALYALNRISRDLESSCVESVAVRTDISTDSESGRVEEASALSFLSAVDDKGEIHERTDGTIVWHHYEVIYLDGARHLLYIGIRPLQYDDSDGLVMRLESYAPDPLDRPLARGVRRFSADAAVDALASSFVDPAAPVHTNPVTLKIEVRDDTETCALTTAVDTALSGDPIDAAPQP